jgi:ABC-2 type transport system ATP-binding protein
MTGALAVVTAGITKSYGAQNVLDGVDLNVRGGSLHALLGPNGAGKTTLVRILATLTRPDGGTARVAGLDVVADASRVRRSISLTGQYASVDNLQTGEENLRMMGRLVGLSRRDAGNRARYLLDRFDLTGAGRRRVGAYSGGMRRRLDLAVSLVGRPSVIFLDEPTTGLDLPSRQAMYEVIQDLVGSGVTVLLTTQYLEEADLLADRIGVLDHGRIIADGTATELKSQVGEQRIELTAATPAAYRDLASRLGERAVSSDVDRLTIGVATDGTAAHVRHLLDEIDPARATIDYFAIHTATLDDVFLALTGHATDIETHDKETVRV